MTAPLSVILCTHNPRRDYLRRTLDSLRTQTLPPERWEFLLVDNASKARLADDWDLAWHPGARHVREEELGLIPARLRGIREARGELLVFVDDDNVVSPHYLEKAEQLLADHPFLGAFGSGALEPEFEVTPDRDLVPHLGLLALRTVPAPLWSNHIKDFACVPWGAGLCVTSRVADAFGRLVSKLNATAVLGPRGPRLFRGDDDLVSWASAGIGLGFGIFPELHIKHLISAERVKREYLVQLIHDHAFSHGVLEYLLADRSPRRVRPENELRLFVHRLRNGKFSMQVQQAALMGEAAAAQFVSEHRLHRVDLSAIFKDPPAIQTTR